MENKLKNHVTRNYSTLTLDYFVARARNETFCIKSTDYGCRVPVY